MRIRGGCLSVIGNSRKNNQDAIFFECVERNGQSFAIGVVCDGIGGLERGELASAMVAEFVKNWFYAVTVWLDIAKADGMILFAHLKDAAEEWNEQLYEYGREHNILMGTTMSVIMVLRDIYYIVHVGDSRIYYYHDVLEVLTIDASISMIRNSRVINYLENYVGREKELRFQTIEGKLIPGDMMLFCSDGFYRYMREQDVREMYQCLRRKKEWYGILRSLISRVIERGEKDNVSLGIIMAENKRVRFSG